MDRDYKKSRKSDFDETYLKHRKHRELDDNEESRRIEDHANSDLKKFKSDRSDSKHDTRLSSSKPEKFQISSDNLIVKDLDDSYKLENFEIGKDTVKHLNSLGFTHLFPIQAATFNIIKEGKDLIARDKTGSGKTLSYALPITETFRTDKVFKRRSGQKPLALIVLPTRELVIQVVNTFKSIRLSEDEYRVVPIYGGTEIRAQIMDVRDGAEIIVGTPGRLIDLLERKAISLTDVRVICLDEADHMLDMGFQEDIEKIYDYIHGQMDKENLQTLLFSATIPGWVHDVSKKYLRSNIEKVDLIKGKEWKTPSTVQHYAINCPYFSRNGAIGDVVLCYGGQHCRTIIFTETKKEANEILLEAHIKQECQVLHGDIPQKQREITFRAFREGKFKCLVATNVAARGLDIPEVDLIIQLSPPKDMDTYIHRAGRTARAGRSGVCVTFYAKKNMDLLDRIERKANIKFQRIGAPQPADIIKATSRDIVTSIKKVPNEVINMFKDISKELIDDLGASQALCRALAIISGTNEAFKQRSLLCSIEGFVTYLCETDAEIRSVSYVWNFLKRYFSADITDNIKGMRIYKNWRGAAFDVPEAHDRTFQDFIEENQNLRGFTLKKAETLPEFNEDPNAPSARFSGGGYNSYNNTGYNSYNSNGGGRDSGRGDSRVLKSKDDCKIFIGGLPFDVKEGELEDFFAKEGYKPEDVLLLKDNEGNSKGVAFAIFRSRDEAEKATRLNGKRLGSRSLRINMANDKPDRRK